MSDDVRTDIMNAADRAFAQFGFKKTAVEDVAKGAGIGKGTVYLYFESKEALFDACVRRKRDELLSIVVAAVAKAKDPESKLRAFITAKVGQPLRFYTAYDLKLAPLLDLAEHTLRHWPEQEEREAIVLEQILTAGVEEGVFAVDDARLTARGIVSLLGGMSLKNVTHGPQPLLQAAEKAAFELLVAGVKRASAGDQNSKSVSTAATRKAK